MDTPSANPTAKPDVRERKRIPMSVPRRKLEVPEKPGFRRHWFLERNVPSAIQGGYDPVQSNDVSLNQHGLGTKSSISGNADLGSGVKVVGGTGEGGNAEYLVLMEIREEWWKEDHKAIEARNAAIMETIFNKERIAGSENLLPEDRSTRYVKTALFQRPTRKA